MIEKRSVILYLLHMFILTGCAATDEHGALSDGFATLTTSVANASNQTSRPSSRKYVGIRSILVFQNDQVVYEKYFNDGSADKPVNMASLGKSILSAMIGVAMDKGIINSIEDSVYRYFPYTSYAHWSIDKADVKIKHLLTMSPGWKCGSMMNPKTHCGVQMHKHKDKLKWLLDLPMEYAPGERFNYSDAVPHVLVAIQAIASKTHPAKFFEQYLQKPLGIEHNPYEANQLTTHDMLKIGQLYLNKGRWNGQQIISEAWVDESTRSVFQFKKSRSGYGYLWWQKTFRVNDTEYPSFYAAGNGGQYIFVVPSLNLVTVFTGSNYGNLRLTSQPIAIMQKHILPTVLSE